MPLSPSAIFPATLPLFFIILLGWWLRRRGKLPADVDHAIVYLTVYVTYPAFILHKMHGDPALHEARNLVVPAACGAGFMLLGMAVAWLVAPWFGLRERRTRGSFAVASSIQNYGYFPIPILAGLFPDHAWAGTLFIFSLGIEFVLWTAGITVISGSARGATRALFNPVLLSILIGIMLNLIPWETSLPGWLPPLLAWVPKLLEMLGNCSFPLGLLIFGATLADLLQAGAWRQEWRTSVGAVLLRMGLFPVLMVLITLWIAPSEQLRHVIGVQAAMPAAMFPLIMAKRYGGDEATAMRVILFTTLVSFATIPFVVQAALHWLAGR